MRSRINGVVGIVGPEPLPPDLQRQALAIFAELLQAPDVRGIRAIDAESPDFIAM
jgi:hypothetical protein